MGRRPGAPEIRLRPGKTVYTCRFTANGRRYDDVSTGETDPERARGAARKLQAEALLGRSPKRGVRIRHADQNSLKVLSAIYLESVEASGRAASYAAKQKMHFRKHFLRRWSRLSDLTTAAIGKYPAARAAETTQRDKPPTTVTVYKELVTLSCFLRWCVRAGHLDAVPVFDRVRPVSDYKPPDLSPEDVAAVLAELPTRKTHPKRFPARERYTVQWAQGMRDGEISTLRWSDVDLRAGRLTIRQSNDKARVGRTVALSAPAREVLEQLAKPKPLPSALVFGRMDMRHTLREACKRAGVEPFSLHDLRRAWASHLYASGELPLKDISALLGHRAVSTTERYLRLSGKVKINRRKLPW